MKSTYATITNERKLDPRVVRTRHLLLNSFKELLRERGAIRDISIQSISERAGVNRVTFYDHFTDKYELLDFWKRELFRQTLAQKLDDSNNLTLEQLIDAVLDFMQDYQRLHKRINQQFDLLFETAIQSEIKSVLTSLLGHEEIAVFLSWAIFGSANEWSKQQDIQTKEAMTKQLLSMVNVWVNS